MAALCLTPTGWALGAVPVIATQPASGSMASGQTKTLSVVAAGTAPLSYQWYQGVSGATTVPVGTNAASYTTPALTAAKTYWVRVRNAEGSVNSKTANLTIAAPPVAKADAITMQAGQKARIPVLDNDTGGITASTVVIVQPPQSGTAVPDASGQVLYIPAGAPVKDTFSYRVSGAGGTSAAAPVTITFSTALRLANASLKVPAAPPPTAYALPEAFAGVSVSQPVGFATPPGETQRLFFLQKTGLLRLIPNVAAPAPVAVTFLDLPALLAARGDAISFGGEQGLLGLAFHPHFATNGYFYLFYSFKKKNTGFPFERVSRFKVQAGNPNAADPASELVLIEQLDEIKNHQGGDLHFGADGYLYISVGDEGGQNDSYNNSQRIDKDFFSGMLRIDVDKKPGNLEPHAHAAVPRDGGLARYKVPADNPWVGATTFNGAPVVPAAVRTEFWAVGLRNPWRFSFDAPTGELWLGHVGQDAYEAVALLSKGKNYGWAYYEGNQHAGPKTPLPGAGFTFAPPLYEYRHGSAALEGNSVTGGLVYRGARLPALQGAYLFADYVSGNIWALTRPGGVVKVQRIAGQTGIAAFGTDPSNGDLLLADYDGSRILRLTKNTAPNTFPATLSATRLFADLTDLAPSPGVLPYTPNLSFWSDFAVKRRWFVIPSATSQMIWAREGAWTYPAGTIWIKHFDLETTRTNPPTPGGTGPRKRVETRLLVKNATGVYGVSYRWNAAGTDATLVDDAGVDFNVAVTQNGKPFTQVWHIPSRTECVACHNAPAGGALSFDTRQLNRVGTMNGFTGNQLDLLRQAGYFTAANPPESPNVLPRHLRAEETSFPLEARVRSYLAVNCSNCHRPGGPAPTAWDARAEVSLAEMGIVNAAANNNRGNSANRLVVPGDTLHSIILNRVSAANGFSRMPPLATTQLDLADSKLLTDWIVQALPKHQTYDQWRQTWFASLTTTPGAPASDPDVDQRVNEDEFLTGTNPKNAASFFTLQSTASGPQITVKFTLPADRSFQVETSADGTTWKLWNTPGNQGLPTAGGALSLTGPKVGTTPRFRLRLWEN